MICPQTSQKGASPIISESCWSSALTTARESLTLKVPGATVAVTASAAAHVPTLRAKWSDKGEPVLKAAGVATYAELDAAVKRAEARLSMVPQIRLTPALTAG